jgi:poly-gamma-glutamate synthesis protein (capsule biosynthesis protein)
VKFLAAVGDVLIDRPQPCSALAAVQPILSAADVVFGNFEGVLSDATPASPGVPGSSVVATSNAEPLTVFDVLSLANNHVMDAGYSGMADTVAVLTGRGVQVAGAGESLDDAFRPAITTVGGTRVAFVACTSVLVVGTQAGVGMPGVAPLRAEDCYTAPFPGHLSPGVPAKVVSVLNEADWARAQQAIADARDQADLVVVSAHWGDHTRPWVVTEHERLCAELFVEAGADLVLGHHQHVFRGFEQVEGTPVFYGLGNLVFDLPRLPAELRARGVDLDTAGQSDLAQLFGEYGVYPRPGGEAFPLHPRARITAVALVEIEDGAFGRCLLVPCLIDETGDPHPLSRNDSRWSEVVAFFRACLTRARLDTDLVDEEEVYAGHPLLTLRAK